MGPHANTQENCHRTGETKKGNSKHPSALVTGRGKPEKRREHSREGCNYDRYDRGV